MLKILARIEKDFLPDLLLNQSVWKSVFVDYHPPFVERLWTSVVVDGVQYRIYLHRILPCNLTESLFHPHPWPSAMKILSGKYSMNCGYGPGNVAPPVSLTLELPPGSTYEMINEDSWHSVCPEGSPSFSLMITGTPWGRESPKSTKKLDPLSQNSVNEIFDFFKSVYFNHF